LLSGQQLGFWDIRELVSMPANITMPLGLKKRISLLKLIKKTIETTVSIGTSLFPQDGKTASQLLHYSDMALCEAKKNGGNQIWFYKRV